jgi:hypothetical protein
MFRGWRVGCIGVPDAAAAGTPMLPPAKVVQTSLTCPMKMRSNVYIGNVEGAGFRSQHQSLSQLSLIKDYSSAK